MNYILNEHLNKEFNKLYTYKDKRAFIENVRFLMMSDNVHFQNYYSNKKLSESNFYAVIDVLYQLDNLVMLVEFVQRNKFLLYHEVDRLIDSTGKLEFLDTCKLGEDTIMTRVFHMFQNSFKNNEGKRK